MLHSTEKSTNLKKSTRLFIDRKLWVDKIKAKCDATMTTIVCLISSLSSTMLLNLIYKKRWNSKIVAITTIEKLLKISLLIKKLLKKTFESTTKNFYKRYNAFKKIKKKSFYNCQKIKKKTTNENLLQLKQKQKWRRSKKKMKKWEKTQKKRNSLSSFFETKASNRKTRRRFIDDVKTRFNSNRRVADDVIKKNVEKRKVSNDRFVKKLFQMLKWRRRREKKNKCSKC